MSRQRPAAISLAAGVGIVIPQKGDRIKMRNYESRIVEYGESFNS
jgi:hypothetical protein